MNLDGKVAIVTGGVKGIGLAIVKDFLSKGARVVVGDYDEAGVKVLAALNDPHVRFLKVDVSDEAQVKALIERTVKTFGRIDIMVANAGIGSNAPTHLETTEDYRRVMSINLDGVFFCNKYAVSQMLMQESGGSIINMASILGLVGTEFSHTYVATKGALVNYTRAMAVTYAKQNIRVNAICPGYIETPMTDPIEGEMREDLIKRHPIGRFGTPEEIAYATSFLVSDQASFITGIALAVDGGYTAW